MPFDRDQALVGADDVARARPSRAAAGRRRRAGAAAGAARAPRACGGRRGRRRGRRAGGRSRQAGAGVAAAAGRPSGRGRRRSPGRGRRGSGGRARPSAASRSTSGGSPSQSRTATKACSLPTIGPRTQTPWSDGVEEDVDEAPGPRSGRRPSRARSRSCGAGQRPLVGERLRDRLDPPLGLGLPHPGLPQPRPAGGPERRRRQRLQQRIVLAADQVQRAAVDPGDDQPPLGERPVDVRRRRAPSLRARTASRAPRGSCPWIASSRSATATGSRAGRVAAPERSSRARSRPIDPERTSTLFVEGVHRLPRRLSLCRRAGSRPRQKLGRRLARDIVRRDRDRARVLPRRGQLGGRGGVDREDDAALVDRVDLGRVDEFVAAGSVRRGVEDDAVEEVGLGGVEHLDDGAELHLVAGEDGDAAFQRPGKRPWSRDRPSSTRA